ncbi:MAG: four helix bundle protein [Candidatus Peribacteraceae bacterium]|nr:four helix bundle protein [Candidatus Peribacteraceae bacterium]
MKSFEDLKAWQSAMNLIEEIYLITSTFPKEETYGITSQVRRSANSIAANIAEGFGRYTYPDKANKYVIARGECHEVRAFLLIASRLNFIQKTDLEKSIQSLENTGRLLSGLIKACRMKNT